MDFTREELEELTKDDLQELLREADKKVSGNKPDLVDRLLDQELVLDDDFFRQAAAYNRAHGMDLDGISAPHDSLEFAQALAEFQQDHDLTVDGKLGPNTLTEYRVHRWSNACFAEKKLDKRKVLYTIQRFEGSFHAANRDGEFRGLFGEDHWAYQNRHIGLSFGFIQFTQDGGSLGELMKLAYDRHPEKLEEVFSGLPLEDLIEMLGRPRGQVRHGRSRRVQPLAGEDIWEGAWLRAFRKFGRMPAFQKCQVDLAIEDYLEPTLETCSELGLCSERAVLMCLDRGIQMGTARARELFHKYHDGQTEHRFLKRLYDVWHEGLRWSHRPATLFMAKNVYDGPMWWD